MGQYTQHHINSILEQVQNLEEISGPSTLAEYVHILETVKAEIEERIGNAKTRIAEGEE